MGEQTVPYGEPPGPAGAETEPYEPEGETDGGSEPAADEARADAVLGAPAPHAPHEAASGADVTDRHSNLGTTDLQIS